MNPLLIQSADTQFLSLEAHWWKLSNKIPKYTCDLVHKDSSPRNRPKWIDYFAFISIEFELLFIYS